MPCIHLIFIRRLRHFHSMLKNNRSICSIFLSILTHIDNSTSCLYAGLKLLVFLSDIKAAYEYLLSSLPSESSRFSPDFFRRKEDFDDDRGTTYVSDGEQGAVQEQFSFRNSQRMRRRKCRGRQI